MRTIRRLYRVLRFLIAVYTVVRALSSSRWFFIGMAIWRMLRKSKRKEPVVADIAFVDGADAVLYKRAGWRTIIPRRVGKDPEERVSERSQ